MGSRFKKRGVRSIEADERGGAEAGAAGEVDCFDVGGFCDGPTSVSHQKRRAALQKARSHDSVEEPLGW